MSPSRVWLSRPWLVHVLAWTVRSLRERTDVHPHHCHRRHLRHQWLHPLSRYHRCPGIESEEAAAIKVEQTLHRHQFQRQRQRMVHHQQPVGARVQLRSLVKVLFPSLGRLWLLMWTRTWT